jgi:MFS superfamily sulfate permease-like transporter
LATDLLIGVAFGLVLKLLLHLKNGAPLKSLFQTTVEEKLEGQTYILKVHDAAVFTNYLGLKKRIANTPQGVDTVVIDFDRAWVVDHTVLGKLHAMSREWADRKLVLTGLDGHQPMSSHQLASRRKSRSLVTA